MDIEYQSKPFSREEMLKIGSSIKCPFCDNIDDFRIWFVAEASFWWSPKNPSHLTHLEKDEVNINGDCIEVKCCSCDHTFTPEEFAKVRKFFNWL